MAHSRIDLFETIDPADGPSYCPGNQGQRNVHAMAVGYFPHRPCQHRLPSISSNWYQSGNLALGVFLAIFVTVAAYHNRVETRIHRLRQWKQIKLAHLARMALDWTAIPSKSGEAPKSHPYATDLDLFGPHSLTHLLDTTVSDHGRERLHSWLLEQPPPPHGGTHASLW